MNKVLVIFILCLIICNGAFASSPTPYQVDSPTITGAYTSPVTANTQYLGAIVTVTVTGPVSGTLNIKMQCYDAFSNTYDIPGAAFPPITAPGTYTMLFWPGAVPNPGYSVNRPLDQEIFFAASVSGATPSFPCQLGFVGYGNP